MSAVWDGDTGTVTITAIKDGAPVNLTGATCTVIARSEAGVVTLLSISSSDLPSGKVTADASPLAVGSYDLVLRAVTGSVTATYPSADKGAEVLNVLADLDATS